MRLEEGITVGNAVETEVSTAVGASAGNDVAKVVGIAVGGDDDVMEGTTEGALIGALGTVDGKATGKLADGAVGIAEEEDGVGTNMGIAVGRDTG